MTGRAFRYQRRMAHIEIVLSEKRSAHGAAHAAATGPSTAAGKPKARKQTGKTKSAARRKAAGKK